MIYVDEPDKPYGRMMMCHMVADTQQELIDMVDKIGVAQKWIQHRDTHREHFDIAKSKRELAISHGAIPISNKMLARFMIAKQHGFDWRPGDDLETFSYLNMRRLNLRMVHYCPDWDFMAIHSLSPEFEACTCDKDAL